MEKMTITSDNGKHKIYYSEELKKDMLELYGIDIEKFFKVVMNYNSYFDNGPSKWHMEMYKNSSNDDFEFGLKFFKNNFDIDD